MREPTDKELQTIAAQLEAAVDKTSVTAVLNILSGICDGKAEHFRETWGDDVTARKYQKAARYLERAGDTITIRVISH